MVSQNLKFLLVLIGISGLILFSFNQVNINNDNAGLDQNDNTFLLSSEKDSITSSTTISQSQSSTIDSTSDINTTSTSEDQVDYDLILIEVHSDLTIRPVGVRNANDGTGKLYMIDQRGSIILLQKNQQGYNSSIFLDIKDQVDYGGEKGLLGLAFHPDFSENGYFYVNYISSSPNLRTVISRFTIDANDPNLVDPDSEQIIIEIDQPDHNHNGGDLAFGPDGFLYIPMGDGGGSGDTYGNGQNLQSLLGTILRIDVDKTSTYGNYAIPADNPFKDNVDGNKEEIFAYGLRNPWRMSFDPLSGKLWVGDVGQTAREEIDIIQKGENYGWPLMEGFQCFVSNCEVTGLQLPVHDYNRSQGTVVTGGFVYRGQVVSELWGLYVFADFASGNIWTLDATNPTQASDLIFETNLNISSFGIDENGELYLTTLGGKLFLFQQITAS